MDLERLDKALDRFEQYGVKSNLRDLKVLADAARAYRVLVNREWRQAHEDIAEAYPSTLDEAVEKLRAQPHDPPTEED